MQRYHAIWVWLFLAWMMCYIDRALTGPVISWMIRNEAGFMEGAQMQYALGGIIGSMFFAGYMLTQFPAGYFGDRYGHRAMVVIATAWAGITTLVSGSARTLYSFVTLRVLTGLGEGAYYSNDRAIIEAVTPKEKKGWAMGVVFVGLALGLTIATVLTPIIMDEAAARWGKETAWSVPFLIYAPMTLVISYGLFIVLRPDHSGESRLRVPAGLLALISVPLLISIMSVFYLTMELGWSSVVQTLAILVIAFVLIAVIYHRLGAQSAEVLRDRDLLVMYFSAIPILYTLWFFGFWALMVVSESEDLGLSAAAAYAGLFGLASVIGYPLGGWVCDQMYRMGRGRKAIYAVLCTVVGALVLLMAWNISTGGGGIPVMAAVLMLVGILFSAMQTVHMTLTSDLAPKEKMGQAFGMWNLVAEIGAIASPVVSGTLRDLSGGWALPTLVTAVLLFISAVMVMFVRENASSAQGAKQ